jgi:hypothetical protein
VIALEEAVRFCSISYVCYHIGHMVVEVLYFQIMLINNLSYALHFQKAHITF